MLLLSAITLGGCGIWCTHFTGMTALELDLEDGTLLVVNFELGQTVVSFIFAVAGVYIGIMISPTDPYFLEIEQTRRTEMLVSNMKKVKMSVAVKKEQVTHRIKVSPTRLATDLSFTLLHHTLSTLSNGSSLFSRLWRIAIGGAFAVLGVLGMHYLGMMAQRTNADMTLRPGVVVLSVSIAFFTANAAFWTLFRALTFLPHNEALRLASALIMSTAVCGTHYSGMGGGRVHAVHIARKREVVEAARVTTAQHDSAGRTSMPGSTTSTYAPVPSHSNTTQTPKHTNAAHMLAHAAGGVKAPESSSFRKVYVARSESTPSQGEQLD